MITMQNFMGKIAWALAFVYLIGCACFFIVSAGFTDADYWGVALATVAWPALLFK